MARAWRIRKPGEIYDSQDDLDEAEPPWPPGDVQRPLVFTGGENPNVESHALHARGADRVIDLNTLVKDEVERQLRNPESFIRALVHMKKKDLESIHVLMDALSAAGHTGAEDGESK